MRAIDERAIKAHADQRFRSEYDYALFEYYRSAKVIAFLERSGVTIGGRVLDAGCGGGGMPLSIAEEARQVVGIDPINRFGDAGALEERDHLRAAVVLEQGVVVFGAEPQVGVRLDGALVNGAHASRSRLRYRVRLAFPRRRTS